MTLHFGPSAIHNGRIQFSISDSVVKELGAERISPQPAVSALSDGGITYTFPVSGAPATVQISLLSAFPGSHPFRIQVLGGSASNNAIIASVFVVP